MGLTPPLFELPWYEHVSEIVGHLIWFWSIEIIRRDLRNRITHEPDPEIPLDHYASKNGAPVSGRAIFSGLLRSGRAAYRQTIHFQSRLTYANRQALASLPHAHTVIKLQIVTHHRDLLMVSIPEPIRVALSPGLVTLPFSISRLLKLRRQTYRR
jgi:hypothetical protein